MYNSLLKSPKFGKWLDLFSDFAGRANHWSALIGASHSKNYVLWEYGGVASEGVKQIAELGSPVKMEEEIDRFWISSREWIEWLGQN